jgi:hypothetical protein
MSNLTSDRDTEFVDELHRDQLPMAAGAKICNGAAVALNLDGNAVSAGPNAVHLRGIADETVDNSTGQDGDETIEVITPDGAYFDGDSTISAASLGQACYFSDDHTVTLTAGTNTMAGRIRSVDDAGVLVDLRAGYVEASVPAEPTAAPTTA